MLFHSLSWRWVAGISVGCLVLMALLGSYWIGYRQGVASQKATTLTILDATQTSESGIVLRMAMRVLRTAEKHPETFSKEDVHWYRQLLEASAENYDKVGIPYIRRDEAAERQRDPSLTAENEERRIEDARRVLADARKMQSMLAAKD